MNEALKFLEDAVSAGGATSVECNWEDVLGAVDLVFAEPFSREVERVMLALLRFDGHLAMSESSELPHSMPPEDMLKSFAAQWLVRETGLTHLPDMERVQATAGSPTLAASVKAAIREAAVRRPSDREVEVVAILRPSPRRDFASEILGRLIGRKPPKKKPAARPKVAATQQTTTGNYTMYRIPLEPSGKKVVKKAVILDRGLTYFAGHLVTMRPPEEVAAFRQVFRRKAMV